MIETHFSLIVSSNPKSAAWASCGVLTSNLISDVNTVTCKGCLVAAGHLDPHARPTWDEYGIALAKTASLRGDCRRLQVGAVVLDADHRVVGSGYNGSPPGGPSCLAGQCPRGLSDVPSLSSYDPDGPGRCIALHAECNAVVDAGRRASRGGVIYVTYQPCYMCRLVIQAAGIARMVWLADGEIVSEDVTYIQQPDSNPSATVRQDQAVARAITNKAYRTTR